MDKRRSKGFYLAVRTILTVAAQITDAEERKAFLSSVRVFDEKGKEIELFLKKLK